MTRILLIYPYFRPGHNRSAFRFPPLGLGYLASSLVRQGYRPEILDCTFLTHEDAFQRAIEARADIVGIYSMVTMRNVSLMFARSLRDRCDLLVAGGPLPSCDPSSFWDDFDLVVKGEGESAIAEIVQAYEAGSGYGKIAGLAYRQADRTIETPRRELQLDLDQIPFPARNLFPNRMYMDHWKKHFGYSATTVMTTRGCPFSCEFCSNAVFGTSYRERSSENVLNEVEEALALGYERIHFADDVFTLNKLRILQICKDISDRGLDFKWECLGRVDSIDRITALAMKSAGCDRIFFGIESGDEATLRLMGKRISLEQAVGAVEAARSAGLKTGAFFILCYPGENDDNVLKTIRFATSLPLDYLSFTMPYPLPGTRLFERVKSKAVRDWDGRTSRLSDHTLTFESEFSEAKMKFAILKGQVQFGLRKRLGRGSFLVNRPFEMLTDNVFRIMR
jgi:anaerobic magnesium-protoporphyrin IX monomethyl ester cyclase